MGLGAGVEGSSWSQGGGCATAGLLNWEVMLLHSNNATSEHCSLAVVEGMSAASCQQKGLCLIYMSVCWHSPSAGLAVVEELVSADDAPGELRRLASSPSMPSTPSVPSMGRSASTASAAGSADGAGEGGSNGRSTNGSSGGIAAGLAARGRRLLRISVAVLKASWFLVARLLLAAASPVLVVLLRRLIRQRRFWERGLASAWHNGQRVTREYVDAYRCAGAKGHGWNMGGTWFGMALSGKRRKHQLWLAYMTVCEAGPLFATCMAVCGRRHPSAAMLTLRLLHTPHRSGQLVRGWEGGVPHCLPTSPLHFTSCQQCLGFPMCRSGQLVRGWEGGILRFLAARFAEKHGFWGSIREAVQVSGWCGLCGWIMGCCWVTCCCCRCRHLLLRAQPSPATRSAAQGSGHLTC